MAVRLEDSEDVFLQIVKYLPLRSCLALFQTSRTFRVFVTNFWSQWKYLDLEDLSIEWAIHNNKVMGKGAMFSQSNIALLKWVVLHFPNLRQITITCQLYSDVIAGLCEFHKLQSVHVAATCTSAFSLIELVKKLESRICSLTFEKVSFFGRVVLDNGYENLFQAARDLRQFCCTSTNIAADLLCRNLIRADNLTVLALKTDKLKMLNAFLPNCVNLVSLEVRSVEFVSSSCSVEEGNLLTAIAGLPKLQILTLALSGMSKLPDFSVYEFFKMKQNLKELNLDFFPTGNKSLVNVLVDALSQRCQGLEKLHIFDLEPQPCHLLFEFIGRLKKLEDLKLNVSLWETDLDERWNKNLALAPLKYLWFQLTRQEAGHLYVIPSGLENFQHLEQLTTAFCENLNLRPSFADIVNFATSMPSSLSVLQLVGVITCTELELILEYLGCQLLCLSTESVSMEANKEVKIAEKSSSLVRFSVRNFQVTGTEGEKTNLYCWRCFIRNIVNRCQKLKYLHLPQSLFVYSLPDISNKDLTVSFAKIRWPF